MPDRILTERLTLRPFEEDDAAALFAVFADPDVGRFIGGPHATEQQSAALIARNRAHQDRHGFSLWAVVERESGVLVGEAGLQLIELRGPEVEIGWTIARARWGRGYATEAARAWLDAGIDRLGLDAIVAAVLPENEASHRVARRIGMRREAGLRRVHDADHVIYRATRPAGA